LPIIYTYPDKSAVVAQDELVLSDSEVIDPKFKTKNVTVANLVDARVKPNQIKYDLNATQDGLNVDLNLTSSDASDDSVVQFTAGTNVSLTRNSASEITISASGGGNLPIEDEGIQITGAAAKINFTGAGVTATAAGNDVTVNIPGGGGGYVLPLAANGTRGGIQIGYAQNAKNYPVVLSSEKAYVNVPWTDTNTTNITLTTSGTSGAATWDGTTLNIPQYSGGGGSGVSSFTNANGTYISAGTVNTNATGAVTVGTIDLSAVDGTAVAGTRFLSKDNTWDVPAYTVYNVASSTTNGLMKLASDTEQSVAANAVTSESGRTYGIQFNADDQAVVNVPWTDTDTNTNIYTTDGTLSGARTVTMDGNRLNLNQSTTGDYIKMDAPTANASPTFIDGRRNGSTRAKFSLNSGSGRLELFHFGSTKYVDLDPGGLINYFLTDTAIGNTTASARLHVKGGSGADSLLVENNAGTDILNIKDSGAFTLGLGATNTAGDNSVIIGKSATDTAATNTYNTIIGASASVTGASNAANVVVGDSSLSTASGGVAIGSEAQANAVAAIAIGQRVKPTGANSITLGATGNTVTPNTANVFSVYMTSNTTPDFKVVGGGTSDLQTKLDLSEQLLIRGDGSANAGNLKLNCYANSHHVNLIGPDHTSAVSYNIKFPNAGPSGNNKILESDSSGNLNWIDTPSGGGSSSKLGFTPLSIYGATHEVASGQAGKTIYRQSVVETDCVIDKVDFFVTAVTGTCNLTVAVYTGNLTTATRVLIGTSGALTTGINTITFTSSYTFSAGDDIVIYTSQSAGEEISNSIAGDSGLLNNSLLSRRSASYDATPPTSISPPETSGAEGLALHFYDE